MIKIAVWASGSGSNAENIANYFADSEDVGVAYILTNNPKAGVIERAQRLGIPHQVFTNTQFREGTPVLNAMERAGIDWVVLGGFMRLVPANVVAAFPGKIINIHPALLPRQGGKGMYGHHVHEAVVAARDSESGITIHEVNEVYDEGQILFQASCPVTPEDTPQTVEAKVRALEQQYYPEVVASVVRK
ncbi:MAG TPA: phosphoribosylglycinamide formyltransferase [Cytophagales bacterium]|nr:phosphoribosylglycinamide formyltransferase [Cytophagales bacterium]